MDRPQIAVESLSPMELRRRRKRLRRRGRDRFLGGPTSRARLLSRFLLAGLSPQPERLRQVRSSCSVGGSDEGIVALQIEGGPISLRGELVRGLQVALERFEFLPAA